MAAALADGVVIMDPDARICWLNQAMASLLGRSRDELIGSEAFAMVHPDDLARAIDGIAYSQQFPGRTAVAPFRLRRGDGTWLDVELKTAVLDRHGEEHLAMVVRDGTPRRSVDRALRSVANGEPLTRTAELVNQVVTSRWPNTGVAISLGGLDGQRRVVASGLGAELIDHAAGWYAGPDEAAPWLLGSGPDDVVVVDRTEMSPALQAQADRAGFECYAVATAVDPGGEPAAIIVWFDHTVVARLEFTHAAPELAELLGLALERRHNLWQLGYAARHDALTGLLNRAGFFERFEEELRASRRGGAEVLGVLYADLDGLKRVNDRHGHATGDRVLAGVGGRLRGLVEPTDVVLGRLGGDEFAAVIRVPADEAAARCERLAEAVVAALVLSVSGSSLVVGSGVAAGLELTDDVIPVSVSVGIAIDDGVGSPDHLIERADAAMYRAKAAGRSRWSL